MKLNQKMFVVTGASSGIGLATVRRLTDEGAQVIAVARNPERLGAATQGMQGVVQRIVCDLAVEGEVKVLADELRAKGLIVDGLVHAAGVHALRPLKLLGGDELMRMYSSHVVSAVALSRFFSSSKLWRPEGASLVFISSAAALRAGSGTIAYSAAKAALLAAVRTLAIELAPRHIRVNAISPGVVCTPQSEAFMRNLSEEQRKMIAAEHPLGLGQPEDIAAASCFLLSADSRWITGSNLVIDGGLTLQ